MPPPGFVRRSLHASLRRELSEQRDERFAPPRELSRESLPNGVIVKREHEERLVNAHRLDRRRLGDPRDDLADPLLRRSRTIHELFERLDPVPTRVHEQREGELALIREVVMDHPVRDPGERRDSPRREPFEPLVGEDASGGIEDPDARLRGARGTTDARHASIMADR